MSKTEKSSYHCLQEGAELDANIERQIQEDIDWMRSDTYLAIQSVDTIFLVDADAFQKPQLKLESWLSIVGKEIKLPMQQPQ